MRNPGRTLVALAGSLLVASAPALAAHPSLFYGPGDVARIRAQAQGNQQALAQVLLSSTDAFVGSWIDAGAVVHWNATGRTHAFGDARFVGSSLVVFAFASQLSTDAKYLTLAKGWAGSVASWGDLDLDGTHDLVQAQLTYGLAVAYDLLAPSLTTAEQAAIRATLIRNADALMTAGQAGAWWRGDLLQNHNWLDHAAVGMVGLVLQGEAPAASTNAWVAFAAENARAVKQVLDPITDGTWHEGPGYAAYGLAWHLPFVFALKRLTGTDLGDLGLVRGYGAGRAALQLPERPHLTAMPHGDYYGSSTEDALPMLRYAAMRYRDGVAQAVADRWIAGTPPNGYAPELNVRVFEFLFYDPTVAPADLRARPLDWKGEDQQVAVFRSSWDAGATIFTLKSGPFGGRAAAAWQSSGAAPAGMLNFGHDHADDNAFTLYGNGGWLAPEAAGYFIGHADSPGPQANATVFHNALTIDGAGQLGEGVRTAGDAFNSYPWAAERTGGIPFFQSSAHFGYAIADGAKLYPAALGLKRWDRHALFLDRRWVVVRDVLQSDAAHDYRWLCHFFDGAAQEGTWLRGTGENGQALGVALVAPAAPAVSLSTQAPQHIDALNPAGRVFLAEVRPTQRAANVTFLTALVPVTQAAWASRPKVAALSSGQPEAGLTVIDGARQAVVLFNDLPNQTRTLEGFDLTGQAGVAEYEGGAPARAVLVSGTRLADATRVLITQEIPTGMLEADGLNSDVVRLSGDVLQRPRIHAPRATRILWNGGEVAFTRDGEYVELGTASGGDGGATGGGTGSGSGGTGSAGSAVGGGGAGAVDARAASCEAGAGGRDLLALGALLLALGLRARRAPRFAR